MRPPGKRRFPLGDKGHLSPAPPFVLIFTMARLARMVVTGLSQHVTQLGNHGVGVHPGSQHTYIEFRLYTERTGQSRLNTVSDPINDTKR
jgi:hypothetical protein